MHVAVCVVGFRNADEVADCLSALWASTHADFEVVVCENGGAQAYAALKALLPSTGPGGQAVLVCDGGGNIGYAGGVNVCLRNAPDADAWWVLNPDTRADPEALAHLVARLGRGDCDAVGSTVYFPDGRVEGRGGLWRPWLARAVALDHGKTLDEPATPNLERGLGYLSGASMLVGRSFLDAIGPMREDYFLYSEEIEWCQRGLMGGKRLGLAIDARVMHRQGTTTGSVADLKRRPRMPVYLDERNKLLLTRDHHPSRLPVVALTTFALLCLRFGKRRAWPQLGYAISGWFAGLCNRRGRPDWVDGLGAPAMTEARR